MIANANRVKTLLQRPKCNGKVLPGIACAALLAMTCAGCDKAQIAPVRSSSLGAADLKGVWTVTAIGTERERWTYEDPSVNHTYVLSVDCQRGSDTVALLYYDQLPETMEAKVGDRIEIHPIGDAVFVDFGGGGFRLEDVRVELK